VRSTFKTGNASVGTIIVRKSGDQQSNYKLFKKGSAPKSGQGNIVGIATGYGLDSPGIKSREGARFSTPVQITQHAAEVVLFSRKYSDCLYISM